MGILPTENCLKTTPMNESPHSDSIPMGTIENSLCLQGETVTFTGTLASMTHAEGAKLVEKNGGTSVPGVSKKLTILVVGEEGWPLEENGDPSVKLQQTIKLRSEGHTIRILKESNWLHLLGLNSEREEIQRLYTPAMISQLLNVPVHIVRSWEHAGLIQAVRTIGRLPYFNFSQVSRARKLSELLAEGADRSEIVATLSRLQNLLSQTSWEGSALEVLSHNSHIVMRDSKGMLEPVSGQRLMNFEPEEDKPKHEDDDASEIRPMLAFPDIDSRQPKPDLYSGKDWYVEGCRLAENGKTEEAIVSFRKALRLNPNEAEAHFHLADCLYRLNRPHAALERYYSAIEADSLYIEAWTQIGCLQAELQNPEEAIRAFEMSLDMDSEFPDAHLHLAEVLHQSSRSEEAIPHWEAYLNFDDRGPWADIARQRLAHLTEETPQTVQ